MEHRHRPKQRAVSEKLLGYRSVEKKKLKLCIAITASVMVVEVVGGLFTHSLALISDAGHMFTHFFALAISLAAIACSGKPACHHRTFGFYRIEVLSALLNSLFLFAVSSGILIEGIKRVIHPAAVLSLEMFIIALIGLAANIATALILWGANKANLNIKSAFLHMLADTLSSVAIIIGAVIIHFTKWNVIDPLLSVGIALLILFWGWGLFVDSVNILLETAPKGITSDDVADVLKREIALIDKITDLHLWVITSDMYSMTAHIKFKNSLSKEDEKKLLKRIKQLANERFDIEHTTIEVE